MSKPLPVKRLVRASHFDKPSYVAQDSGVVHKVESLLSQTIRSISGPHSTNKLTSSDRASVFDSMLYGALLILAKAREDPWPDHLCTVDISDSRRPNRAREAFKPVPRGIFQAVSESILPAAVVLHPIELFELCLCFLSVFSTALT